MSRVPTEQSIKEYLQEKHVSSLFVALLEGICIETPDDVPSFMVNLLEKNFQINRSGQQAKSKPKPTPIKTPAPKKAQAAVPKKEDSGPFIPTFTFGSRRDEDEDTPQVEEPEIYSTNEDNQDNQDEDEDESPTKLGGSGFGQDDKANDQLLSDTAVDLIRRRYSVSVPRRIGISNESLKVDEHVKFPVIPKTESERVQLTAAIDKCSVFKHLENEDKKVVFDAMAEKNVEKGDVIIQQGDEGDLFYVVDSGDCDIIINDKKVGVYHDGDSFGELALIYGTPRAATIKATTDVKLWHIDRTTFRTILMGQTMNRRKLYEDFLRNVEILKTIDDYERLTIADALQAENWTDGSAIVTQGDAGHSFYIIVEGEVFVKKDGVEVAVLKSGDYFGEMALMFNQPRAATVVADGPVKTVRLDRRSFKLLLGPCEDVLKRNTSVYNQFMSKQI
ncbi:cAMP-dependent protein kinase type I regulatory subunit [Acrasis kona]|uniref:cGMP-dependent protein kinase n=1 Tax=Acrasis kona TaxID=1008807 RepID=A0AAW2ZDB5_9EUKA